MSAQRLGELVARTLAGSWHAQPPPPDLSVEDLERVAPLLHRSGAGALAWRRLRQSSLADVPAGQGLRQAYRLQSLEAVVHQRHVVLAFRMLGAAGVEPLLGKGWAAARLYPEDGIRPSSDVDLCVRPDEYPVAAGLLMELARQGCCVDLHAGFPQLRDRPLESVYARSQLVPVDGAPVRLLGPEDHLRLLCLHMLGHGMWRPLWLCDIAAALESTPEGFDWEWFVGGDPRRADWAACALVLAHDLLGARLDRVPGRVRDRRLPSWLAPAALSQWGRVGWQDPQGARTPMSNYLRRPEGVISALYSRWPNPIEATVGVGGAFNEVPRWPFQVGACLWRTARFAARLPALLREQR